MTKSNVDVLLYVNVISEEDLEDGPGFFSVSLHSISKERIITHP